MIDLDEGTYPAEINWAEGKVAVLLGIGVEEAALAMIFYADARGESVVEAALEILTWPAFVGT